MVDVSEIDISFFDRNLGSELTEPSQCSNEIEAITQRLSEQNSHKMTQTEQHLNSKFEEILKEIRRNRDSNLANDEEDAESNRRSTSSSENKSLKRKHASNNEINKDTNQDNRFHSSEMYDIRQPSSLFGVVNETLNDKIIMNKNRQEADYHNIKNSGFYRHVFPEHCLAKKSESAAKLYTFRIAKRFCKPKTFLKLAEKKLKKGDPKRRKSKTNLSTRTLKAQTPALLLSSP